MTAIDSYQRLEVTGLWRAGAGAQRREVIVSLGEASLTLNDPAGQVLTHWSLAAIQRLEVTDAAALYCPDGDPDETLELGEEAAEMVAAIERVRAAISARRPRPGRLRWGLRLVAILAILAAGWFWLPDALVRYAAQVMPDSQRARIGGSVLTQMSTTAGAPCRTPSALPALRHLSARLLDAPDALIVLPALRSDMVHLPGGAIVLNRSVIETWDRPEIVAGHILTEAARRASHDPMQHMLAALGPLSSARLLVTGALTQSELERYAELVQLRPPVDVTATAIRAEFARKSVSSAAYAETLPDSDPLKPVLMAQDPYPLGGQEILNDSDWVRLQGLCGG